MWKSVSSDKNVCLRFLQDLCKILPWNEHKEVLWVFVLLVSFFFFYYLFNSTLSCIRIMCESNGDLLQWKITTAQAPKYNPKAQSKQHHFGNPPM